MTWDEKRASTPMTLEDWMAYVDRELIKLSNKPRGLGLTVWLDAVYDTTKFKVHGSYEPGWRRLEDGRVELRGKMEKIKTVNGQQVNDPLTSGTVIMQIPYECSPPNNEQTITALTTIAPCTIAGGNPGVYRIDIQREAAWKTEQRVTSEGKPILDVEGQPIYDPVSMVEIIARPPKEQAITGWISFDTVIYDPHMYIDALAPVPRGQKPLVREHGYVIKEHPDGRIEWFLPGVDYSS